jgi:AraC-like DNA-binding protein
MAAAYMSLSVLNIAEILTRSEIPDMELTQSITLIMSVFQALLYTCAFIILINPSFITRRNIFIEVGAILLLSGLLFFALFWDEQRSYFLIAFYIFVAYYLTMLIRYTVVFLRNYRRYMYEVDNYFSEKETARLRWIFYTFFVALTIGIGALLLTFSETTLHYILFTVVFICFYTYFGIKFINYTFSFGEIEPIISEENSPVDMLPKQNPSANKEIELKITHWIQNKEFVNHGITIEQLSKKLATNRTYLSKYINSSYEKTFNEWINDLRIEEAKQLLYNNPQLSINQVSEKVGYANQSHFGRQFTKRVGVSPRLWLNTQNND